MTKGKWVDRVVEGYLVEGLLVGALDHVLPWGVGLWLALPTELLCSVLKVCDVGLASLVSESVIPAPFGGDPAEVTA